MSFPPASRGVTPRDIHFRLDETIPRHWFAGDALATHVGNGFNLVFPEAERFVIKSVRRFADRLTDEDLRARVRGFVRQEANHSREHEGFLRVLSGHGFETRPYLAFQRRVFRALERRLSPELLLATTAAAEHYTATLGEVTLRERPFDAVHPVVRDLFMWHAAEEVEHKSVAFEVLRAVDPGYGLRVAGLVVASATIAGLWLTATLTLIHQDRTLPWRGLARQVRSSRVPLPWGAFAAAFREWLRPGFAPSAGGETDAAAVAYQYRRRKGTPKYARPSNLPCSCGGSAGSLRRRAVARVGTVRSMTLPCSDNQA
jgi:predicted metal-dependent hydrolase